MKSREERIYEATCRRYGVKPGTTKALVELRYYRHTAYQRSECWRRELVVVPFKPGPRCWINAYKAAGGIGRASGGSFTNEKPFAEGQTDRTWIGGYARAIRPDVSTEKAIADRIKFIREDNSTCEIAVIKKSNRQEEGLTHG